MKGKYNNTKVEYDGHKFDSVDECKYYQYLCKKKQEGFVKEFELQPHIVLIPAVKTIDGANQRAVTYTPDFYVTYIDGGREYIDVKGFSTQQGDLRRKLYNYLVATGKWIHRIPLRWVSASKKWGDASGFLNYDDLAKKRKNAKKGVTYLEGL